MKHLKRDIFIVALIFAVIAFRRELIAGLPSGITEIFIKNDERIIDMSDKIRYKGIPEVKDTGNIVDEINHSPFFKEEEKKDPTEFLVYENLDLLKRPGQAFSCLSSANLSDEDTSQDSEINPVGWNQDSYPKIIPQKVLYRRCHTISSRLNHDIKGARENTFIGTQYMYQHGIKKMEDKVIQYLKKHPENHVLYRVTPIYISSSKIARHILMEAYSIEDNGKLQFCVAVHNEQPGVLINYANGKSKYQDPDTISEANKQIPIPKVKTKSKKRLSKKK